MKAKRFGILLAVFLAMTGCGSETVGEETQADTQQMQETVVTENDGADTPGYAENPTVQAVYGSTYTGEWDHYPAEEGEYAVDIVFITDGAVRDFQVLALTVTDISEEGELSFAFEELYTYGELTPERGLAVKMSLPETIPFYGISYRDGAGNTRVFSVNLSGFDGSVYLTEIQGAG